MKQPSVYPFATAVVLLALASCARIEAVRPAGPGTPVAAPAVAVEEVRGGPRQHQPVAGGEVVLPAPVLLPHDEAALRAGTAADLLPVQVAKLAAGRYQRVRLLRVEGKYPLLRRVEVVRPVAGGVEVVSAQEMVADHLMVSLEPGRQAKALAEAVGGSVRRVLPGGRTALIAFAYDQHDSYAAYQARLAAQPGIRAVDPDWIVHAIGTPDDSAFAQLWGMDNSGQTGGTPDADIDAPEAWNIHTGSSDVLVGVIDTGIDATHPDLASNMWQNPGETGLDGQGNPRQSNGLDDDGNGYIDDWRGWDFVNNDNDPHDDHYHGTHCAGTIGGVGNNGQGVAGVCWDVSLVGLKFLSSFGSGAISDAVEATLYANAIGCELTSNSWGGGGYTQAMHDAISAADQLGILFVAAAGNSGSDNDVFPHYPSSYDNPNVIAVAATDHNDALAYFSCWGATSVDLGAPGVSVYSCQPNGLYQLLSGTSMATPHVAGACALLKSVNPSLSGAQIKATLLAQADPIPALAGKTVSGARLNLHAAVLAVAGPRLQLQSSSVAELGDGDGIIEAGESAQVTCVLASVGSDMVQGGTVQLSTADPAATQPEPPQSLGDLAPGQTASVVWTVAIAPTAEPHSIACLVEASASNAGPWSFAVDVQVHASATISGQATRLTGAPLAGAAIVIDGGAWSTVTAADGTYLVTVHEGVHQVVCSAPGLSPQTLVRTTPPDAVADFQLGAPDIEVSPASLSFVLQQGDDAEGTISIGNLGDRPLNWTGAVSGGLNELDSPVATGLWHASSYRTTTLPSSWYYGQESTRNYDTGASNSGTLTFAAVNVGTDQALSFTSWRQTEGGSYWDQSLVQVSTDLGTTWTTIWQETDTAAQWRSRGVSLAGYAGQQVQIRFSFNTLDPVANGYEGWYVDQVRVVAASSLQAVLPSRTVEQQVAIPELSEGRPIIPPSTLVAAAPGAPIGVRTGEGAFLSPAAGVAAAGGSQDVTLSLLTSSLTPGSYPHVVTISSDDPDEPVVSIPVTILVVGSPVLTLPSQLVTDQHELATGDGDGFAEPGERIVAIPSIQNTGNDVAEAVVATVQSVSDPELLTIVQGVSTVGSITAGSTVVGSPVQLQVQPTAPDGSDVVVTWLLSSGQLTWTRTSTVQIRVRHRVDGVVGSVIGVVGGATIQIAGLTTQTLADGSFALGGIPTGEHIAIAAKPGYGTVNTQLTCVADVVWSPQLGVPLLSASPASLSLTAQQGETVGSTITLANAGTDPAAWAAIAVDNAAVGYVVSTSDQPQGPQHVWQDIRDTGTPVNGLSDDVSVGPFPIGFPFPLYGQSFSTFRLCSNGFISFSSSAAPYYTYQLPSAGAPPNLIALMWRDLYPPYGGQVDYQQIDDDTCIVQYTEVPFIGNSTVLLTAQIRLHRDGRIDLVYKRVDAPGNGTVGIQDGTATKGLTIAYNNPNAIHNEMTIRIAPSASWLQCAPNAGTVAGGSSGAIGVTGTASELQPGLYSGSIQVSSNALDHPVITVPVTLQVLASADLRLHGVSVSDAAPDGDGDGRVEPGETVALAIDIRNIGSVGADGVTAVLSSSDARVTVLTADSTYADIPAGQHAIGTPVSVAIAASCPDGTDIACSYLVTDGTGRSWNIPMSLRVEWRSRLSGVVTTVQGAAPVAGAQITVGAWSVVTAGDGTFLLTDLPHATYAAMVTASGFVPTSATLEIQGDTEWNPQVDTRRMSVAPTQLATQMTPAQTVVLPVTLTSTGGLPVSWSASIQTEAATATGLWHETYYRSQSGGSSWYYGSEATRNYNTDGANSGNLRFGQVAVPTGSPVLTFREWRRAETGTAFDRSLVQISVDGGTSWVTVHQSQVQTPDSNWVATSVPLTTYAGQAVALRFRFDTVDAGINTFEGWYIDDISIDGVPVQAQVPWLTLSPPAGVLSTNGDQAELQLTCIGAGLAYGQHQAVVLVDSDDIMTPQVAITVSLLVASATPPVVLPISATTAEDHALVIGLDGSDADGDALTYEILDAPSLGTLSGSGASRLFTPDPDVHGTTTFTYRVSDGFYMSTPATVSIAITSVNDPPALRLASLQVTRNGRGIRILQGTDVDDPATSLIYGVATQAQHGSVRIDGGVMTYVPAPGYGGPDSAVLRVSDDESSSDATITIEVIQPEAAWRTQGNGPAHLGTHPGGLISEVAPTQRWSLDLSQTLNPPAVADGAVYLTPMWGGSYAMALALTDGAQLWRRDLPAANSTNPPTVVDGALYMQRGNYVGDSQLFRMDAGSGAIIWSAQYATQWDRYLAPCVADGKVFINGGMYGGMYGFDAQTGVALWYQSRPQYSAWTPAYADGRLYSWANEIAAHQPDTGQTLWMWQQSAVYSDQMWTAPCVGDGLVVAVAQASGMLKGLDAVTGDSRLSVSGGDFVGTPSMSGGSVFAYSSSGVREIDSATGAQRCFYPLSGGGTGLYGGQPILLDDAVIACSSSMTAAFRRGQPTPLWTIPLGGNIALAGPNLVITSGSTVSCYRLPNRIPTLAVLPEAATPENTPVQAQFGTDDPDFDAVTVTLSRPPQHGAVELTANTWRYTPDPDFAGHDTFELIASDGQALSDPAMIDVTVRSVNHPPQAFDTTASAATGDEVVVTLTGSDADADELTWRVLGFSSGITAWQQDGLLHITGLPGFTGIGLVLVSCSDGQADSATAQVSVTITPLPADWTMGTIGSTTKTGTARWEGGTDTWIVSGAGSGVTGKGDSGQIVTEQVHGDFDLVARIPLPATTASSARVGLIVRESTAKGSRSVFLGVSGDRKAVYTRRTSTNGNASTSSWSIAGATWVRITRLGNTLKSYRSLDGVTWISCGTVTVGLPERLLVGTLVASGSRTRLLTAEITGFTLTRPQPFDWAGPLAINFQSCANAAVIYDDATWLNADGAVFATRWGGVPFGFATPSLATYNRNSTRSLDERFDTGISPVLGNVFEVSVPNGGYLVTLCVGDASGTTGRFRAEIEGVLAISASASSTSRWYFTTEAVEVVDGRLTLRCAEGATVTRWSWLVITPVVPTAPGDG